MRDIKFSILLQHDETGKIVERVFSFADIFNGTAKAEIGKLERYAVIARREYTGLTDKHGKDIFEDDVISIWCAKCAKEQPAWVDFNNGGFIYTGIDCEKHGGWLRTKEARECEIIGNRYEQPIIGDARADTHAHCFFCSKPQIATCCECGKPVCSEHGTHYYGDMLWCDLCLGVVDIVEGGQ